MQLRPSQRTARAQLIHHAEGSDGRRRSVGINPIVAAVVEADEELIPVQDSIMLVKAVEATYPSAAPIPVLGGRD